MKVAKLLRKMGVKRDLAKLAGILMDSEGKFVPDDVLALACGIPEDKVADRVHDLGALSLDLTGAGSGKQYVLVDTMRISNVETGKYGVHVLAVLRDIDEPLEDYE